MFTKEDYEYVKDKKKDERSCREAYAAVSLLY